MFHTFMTYFWAALWGASVTVALVFFRGDGSARTVTLACLAGLSAAALVVVYRIVKGGGGS